jgi:putative membrane protein
MLLVAFIVHILVTALLLVVVDRAMEGVRIESGGAAVVAALVLGIVNAFVRPLVILLTLPLTLITLGLFLFVINALMLMLTAAVVPGFWVRDFTAALLASVLFSVLNLLVAALFGL